MVQLMPQDAVQQISQVYARVEDVDLFVAGVSEYSVQGGVLGPTFACIQANQFMRSKFGDRFYYEHGNQAGSFTPQQLQEIRKSSMAKIICDNSDGITEVPLNVFRHESPYVELRLYSLLMHALMNSVTNIITVLLFKIIIHLILIFTFKQAFLRTVWIIFCRNNPTTVCTEIDRTNVRAWTEQ